MKIIKDILDLIHKKTFGINGTVYKVVSGSPFNSGVIGRKGYVIKFTESTVINTISIDNCNDPDGLNGKTKAENTTIEGEIGHLSVTSGFALVYT